MLVDTGVTITHGTPRHRLHNGATPTAVSETCAVGYATRCQPAGQVGCTAVTVFNVVLWFFSQTMVCLTGGGFDGSGGGEAKPTEGADAPPE